VRPQYRYEPPQTTWLDNVVARAKEPPLKYILIVAGIVFGIVSMFIWPEVAARILILLIAFPIHEFAHAITAYRLGDSTPKYDGRLTLNPFAHLDLFGSILILVAGLGWAKPVRFNPGSLKIDPKAGSMIVAAAGPISNVLLAVLIAWMWQLITPVLISVGVTGVASLWPLVTTFAYINVALFFFNLIPLAPLDGFTVLRGFLPYHLAYQLDRIRPYSMIIFLFLFLFGRFIPIFGWIVWAPAAKVTGLLFGL